MLDVVLLQGLGEERVGTEKDLRRGEVVRCTLVCEKGFNVDVLRETLALGWRE